MCCFSRRVTLVEETKIFARRVAPGEQALAYAMRVEAEGDLAMVLPLPTDPRVGEDAVRFVDLSTAPYLFASLDALFPLEEGELRAQAKGAPLARSGPTLRVFQVGAFEASFVPSRDAFDRLDERFRLAPAALEGLAAASDGGAWGFAVFQLRGFEPPANAPRPAPQPFWKRWFAREPAAPAASYGPRRSFHPMGLRFRTREPDTLFFPTVHVHDGAVPASARFDHTLYAQGADAALEAARVPEGWQRSDALAHESVVAQSQRLVSGGAAVLRTRLRGERPNRDARLAL